MKTDKIAKIEKKWIENFKKSILVNNGEFKTSIAKEIFHGKTEYITGNMGVGYKSFYNTNRNSDNKKSLEVLEKYLNTIGIEITEQHMLYAIQIGRVRQSELYQRLYFILLALAQAPKELDIENPYVDNQGDLYFFLKISSGYHRSFAKLLRFWTGMLKK